MLLFAEDDLVSTSLIHAAVVQSSDIFDETRMLSIKNDKQTAERPIRHIVYILFFRGTGWNSVDMSECIQRSPFQLFTMIFRTSLLNASAWRAFSMNVIIDHLIISENEFVCSAPKRSSWRFVKPKWMVYTSDALWSNISLNLSFRPVLLLLHFFFPLQNTVKVPSSLL